MSLRFGQKWYREREIYGTSTNALAWHAFGRRQCTRRCYPQNYIIIPGQNNWLCGCVVKNVSQLFSGVSDNHFTASCHMTKLIRIRSANARCGMQYHWRAQAKLTKNLSVPNCDLTAQTQRPHCGGNWKSLLAVSDVSLSLQMDPITGQHFLQRSSSSKASKSSEASVSDAACALHKQSRSRIISHGKKCQKRRELINYIASLATAPVLHLVCDSSSFGYCGS